MCTKRVRAIVAVLTLLGAGPGLAQTGADRSPGRMSFVFILTDDLDVRTDYLLRTLGKMPNLAQHVVTGGMIFSEAFVTNSVCCPSRASLLTGQYNHNNGVLNNYGPNGGVTAFDDSATLATWLQNAGYYTAFIGKYLNGYGAFGPNLDPLTDPRDSRYIPPGWDQWFALIDPTTYWMYDFRVNQNGTVVTYGSAEDDYQTDVLSELAVQAIAQWQSTAPARPLFLFVNPTAPHDEVCPGIANPASAECVLARMNPYKQTVRPAPRHAADPLIYSLSLPQGAGFNEADITDKPAWLQQKHPTPIASEDIDDLTAKFRDRMASLLAVDDMIGAIADGLGPAIGSTAFVYTSDNGYLLGQHRLVGKEYVYEDTIRVPLVVRLPLAPASTRSPRLVLNIDWAPTLAQLTSLQPDAWHQFDGRSFAHLYLLNPLGPYRRLFLAEHWTRGPATIVPVDYFAVRTDPALEPNSPAQIFSVMEYPPELGGGTEREHYDMTVDPGQEYNLYDASAGPTADQLTLEDYVDQLRNCAGESCRNLED